MRKYILSLTVLLQSVWVFSQITTSAPQVTKPLPTIGSMMDYVDIPVNTYTGVPDINIPLYSLPTYSKDFNVNLSLNYHPAGVSFFNKASDLGTGWNLTADFAISRTIVYEPDDFYGAANSYKNEFNDVYTYNFFGHTGRFRIVRDISNDTFKVQKMDSSLLDIQFDMNPTTFRINSFTVYDDRGYKYVFDQIDHGVGKFWTHVNYLPYPLNQTMGYLSSHHLKSIFDNNGNNIINYGYTLYESSYFPATTLNNKALKLTTITATGFGKAEINYVYGSSLDYSLSDPAQMTDIQIKDVNNNLIKKIGFTSSYIEFFEKYRRFLKTVTEYDNTLAQVKKYELDYNTDAFLVLDALFPCQDYELGKDMYGYATLMPKYHINNGPSYFQGAINSTLPNVCTIGALTSMKLPTGGTIKYEFESNTIPASINPVDYLDDLPNPALPNDNYSQTIYDSTNFTTSVSTTWQFTVTGTTPKTLFIKGVGTEYTSPFTDPSSPPPHPEFKVTGNGIIPLDLENFDLLIHPCIGKILTLAPGTYTITVNKLPGTATTCDITITEFVVNTPIKGWTYNAGLRIKKISHYDSGAASPSKEANYEYQRFDNPNVSSGYMYYGDMASDINDFSDEFYNNMVGYSNVKVWNTGTSGNGYTKYFYKDYDEELAEYTSPGGSTTFTYAPDILCYKKGLLAKMEVYNDNGDILTSTENDYKFEEEGDVISPTTNLNLFTRYSWANLSERKSKSYTYDPTNTPIETKITETFTYNNVNRQVDEHTVYNSHGEVLKTKNYYHTGNSTLSENRISELEKVETYRDSELLTTSQINYSNTFSGNVSYLPQTVTTAKGSDTPETRLRYTAYDGFGNPLQVQQENGMVTSYIWGYHKTVPVAKIENLDYASIPSVTITAIQNKSDSAIGHGQLRTLLNNLRTSFPDAMITTMTYNPLIGIRTLTDPKGDSIKYQYDNFNRLKAVRDKDDHILTENQYYYTNGVLGQNYIKTKAYKVESADFMSSPSVTQAVQGITYYDGLGRTIQKIANRQSNDGKDIITHISYDDLGRQAKEFLPFASSQNNMAYMEGTTLVEAIINQYNTQYGDHHPYSEKAYEPSPLNRVLEQAAPGDEWSLTNSTKHTIRFDNQTNDKSEVKLFTATSDFINNTITLNNSSATVFYNDKELYKTITKNENWKTGDGTGNTIETFKDKEGRTILSRKYDGSDVNDTYNVYDQYGNLTYVIPPIADGSLGTTELDELCYQYKYDFRNRLIEKKLPGKQWEYIAYNSQDKPVATGPALNPFTGSGKGWLITKYDVFGRVICTGWLDAGVDSSHRLYFESEVNGSIWYEGFTSSPATVDGVTMNYTNAIYPTDFKVLTVNYYDGYDFTGAPSTIPSTVESQPILANVKGLGTGSWVRVLTSSSETFADESYTLYDKKSRPVRTYTTNYLGGFTSVDSKVNFTGMTEYTKTSHKRTGTSTAVNILDTFYYTDQDRLKKHTHKINGGPTEAINENVYDNLGQLIRKDVGGTGTAYQKVNYDYNIRGWLLGINDIANLNVGAPTSDPIDLFAFGINYTKTIINNAGGTILPQYNGNIAETNWRSATDDVLRRYGYVYDKLNRLTNSVYQKPNNAVPVTNMYNESIQYYKNGNIKKLDRNGDYDSNSYAAIQIDQLEYRYKSDNPNLLLKVTDYSNHPKGFTDDTTADPTDSSDDYIYDDYGNMVSDENKNISNILYNHLNLPFKINFGTGDKIEYLYNAVGEKVSKKVTEGSAIEVTDYLDGFQYINDKLEFFPHSEGYVKATYCEGCPGGDYVFNYVYQYKDHLGNIRLSYGFDPSDDKVKVIEENHYYPYGLKHLHYNGIEMKYQMVFEDTELHETEFGEPGMNKYKYNGKEWQDELGLNMYAMDMRQYDPAIARWVVQDPIVHHSQSPYNGYDCNPVFFADPSGGRTMATDYNWKTGEYRSGSVEAAFANIGIALYQPNLHTEMDEDMGVNADGNVFNEISVHVYDQGDQQNPQQIGNKIPPPDPRDMDPSYRVNGKQWKNVGGRETIVNEKGEILQWDYRHGEVEIYDKNNNHKGAFDPYDRTRATGKNKVDKSRKPNGSDRMPKSSFFDRIKGFKLPNMTFPLFNSAWLEMNIKDYNSIQSISN